MPDDDREPPGPSSTAAEVDESPRPLSADLRIDTDRVRPTRANAQVAAASQIIGGPVGRHAAVGRSRYWTPIRVVLLMALLALALGWFGKAGCIQQSHTGEAPGAAHLNWDNQRQFYGLCYSDVVGTYSMQRLTPNDLAAGTMPYRTFWKDGDDGGSSAKQYTEEPALTGMFMYAAAKLTQGWVALVSGVPFIGDNIPVVVFFNISALLLALFWLLAVWATMMTAGRRIWVGALMALSPLIVVHAFTAFDVLGVALLAVALLAWSRTRPVLAGLFVGLAAAAAVYPVLALAAILVVSVRRRRLGDFGAVALAAVIAWLAVNLPLIVRYPEGWSAFYRTWWNQAAGPDTLYRVASEATGWNPTAGLLDALWLTLLLGVVAGVVYVGLRTVREPSVAELMFLLVAGYLLVGKSWTPQSSLWLVPLAVLAVPHARLLIAWMAVDALVWVPRMALFLAPEHKWLPEEWFYVAVVVRAVFVLVLCGVVLRDLLRRPVTEPGPTAPDLPSAALLTGRVHS